MRQRHGPYRLISSTRSSGRGEFQLNFDDVGDFGQGLAVVVGHVIVERDQIARLLQPLTALHDLRIRRNIFQNLHHRRLRRQEPDQPPHQRVARAIHECPPSVAEHIEFHEQRAV
ncbi:MAG: hypothetical protein DMG77_13070 [Acidobacteria bacterium]|nr:MAG: hypothetical protein DMG77_13070 [Acidobacteriota bacterium]